MPFTEIFTEPSRTFTDCGKINAPFCPSRHSSRNLHGPSRTAVKSSPSYGISVTFTSPFTYPSRTFTDCSKSTSTTFWLQLRVPRQPPSYTNPPSFSKLERVRLPPNLHPYHHSPTSPSPTLVIISSIIIITIQGSKHPSLQTCTFFQHPHPSKGLLEGPQPDP